MISRAGVVQAETVGNGPDAVHVEVVPGADGAVQAQFDRGAHFIVSLFSGRAAPVFRRAAYHKGRQGERQSPIFWRFDEKRYLLLPIYPL